ncbi:hypothetical protein ACFODZ_15855 [Marinicella sediminis]|uniref:Uncharacterized protein n=1 Tax=Marinicella sediminis TaxID=1792834 RepID=A0ABV7JFR3_9GAMM|nr:hypothetical protein [Marinicella sediminis]
MKKWILILVIMANGVAQAAIMEIIDSSGDGNGNTVDGVGLNVDDNGNVYITGVNTDNLFRISASTSCTTADCEIIEILDASGDGVIAHDRTSAVATDADGNVYVAGQFSDNVWRILNPINCSTSGTACNIEEIIGPSGDGSNPLDTPVALAVDHSGHVYVAGAVSHNVFRIAASTTCGTGGPACTVTEIIDESGDNNGNIISQPVGLAIDSQNNVFVTTQNSDNVFKIANPGSCSTNGTPCTITEIIDESSLTASAFGRGLVVDSQDNVYLTSLGFFENAAVFKINTPGTCSTAGTACTITEIFNTPTPQQAGNMAVDSADNIYFAGGNGDNAFRIDNPVNCSTSSTPCIITEIIDANGDGVAILDGPGNVAIGNDVDVYVSGGGSDNAFRVSGAAESTDLIFRNGFDF